MRVHSDNAQMTSKRGKNKKIKKLGDICFKLLFSFPGPHILTKNLREMAKVLGKINIWQSYKFLSSDVLVDSSDFIITLSRNVKCMYMYAILRGTSAPLVREVTFALCCAVHAVKNIMCFQGVIIFSRPRWLYIFAGKDQMVDSTAYGKFSKKSPILDSCKILSAMLTEKKAHVFV